tara:strand:- start:867 stop:1880 length:1014 start_codon:yes stop_codon:yes gene_type:complete
MKISASIYSNNDMPLKTLVNELDSVKIDMLHIDFNDEKTEINKIENDIEEIRKISSTPLDLHIISKNPSKYDDFIKRNKIEFVTYQLENINEEFSISEINQTSFGIAITSNTDLKLFKNYEKFCDFILLMTTTPGESGGSFNHINFKKIRDFKNLFPSKRVYVDGGVNDEIAFILRILGVSSVVSGSFLVKNNIPKSLLKLRSSVINSKLKVKEFMISRDESPIVTFNSSLLETLVKIEDYNFGFTLVEDENKKFKGIVSMADIRKYIINNQNINLKENIKNVINKNPIVIYDDDDINKMLETTQNREFLISFIPVLNKKNKIVGCVTFFNLINSES